MPIASNQPQADIVGRFAPSPTGPLHFGSLVAALASFLDARHLGGRWLVRIEDLDPPREQPGASAAILKSLEAHHLYWDGSVLYQSERHPAYASALENLRQRDLVYPCYCTRKALAAMGGPYPGTCRHRERLRKPFSLRLRTEDLPPNECHLCLQENWDDLLLGQCTSQEPLGDFILRRKDGLFAYQLAVVVDDIYQNISHVIRGNDLLASTPSQRFLFACFGAPAPQFGHLPVALNSQGQKLSKQHGATGLDTRQAGANLRAALCFLGHPPAREANDSDIDALLEWAIHHWNRHKVPSENRMVQR